MYEDLSKSGRGHQCGREMNSSEKDCGSQIAEPSETDLSWQVVEQMAHCASSVCGLIPEPMDDYGGLLRGPGSI